MKKITLSVLVIVLTAVGLRKLADSIDSHIKLHSLESDRDVAINGKACVTFDELIQKDINLKNNQKILKDYDKKNNLNPKKNFS